MHRFAIVDTETTGLGKADRVVEIAVVLMDGTEIINEWETLVNPLRDISNSEIHGINAPLVSMAPSFKELSESLANLLDDRILVAHNIAFDKRMLVQEFSRLPRDADLGSGFCTLQATGRKLHVACQEYGIKTDTAHRALTDARATAQLLTKVQTAVVENSQKLKPARFTNLGSNSVTHLLSRSAISTSHRPAQQNLRRIFKHTNFDGSDLTENELSYLDGISSVMSDFVLSADESKQLEEWASILGISTAQIATLHEKFLHSLIEIAKRDGVISDLEFELIERASKALGVKANGYDIKSQQSASAHLQRGEKICFTGKATDNDGNEISRETLETYARELELVPTSSVTKKSCDVLVAQDKTSMSGKAKKARDFGIPIISVNDFLQIYRKKKL